MKNQELKEELLLYINGEQLGGDRQGIRSIAIISHNLDYMLSPENALFIISENLKGDEKMRQAIDDLLQDINYHSFSRALDDFTAAWDKTFPKKKAIKVIKSKKGA